MSNLSKIEVVIFPETEITEWKGQACIDDTVQQNWISHKLASELKLELSPDEKKTCNDWNTVKLNAIGFVTLNWSRVDGQQMYKTMYKTVFHVTQEDSFSILLGKELLSENKSILKPEKGVYPLTSSKKVTPERQRQIEKNQREGKAKVEASEALMRDGGPQQGSQSPGGSSGAGKSKEAKIGKPGSSGSGNTAGAARR